MYKFIFLFISTFVFSQTKTLKVVSSKDNLCIANALIYSENNFLGSTDENGQLEFENDFSTLKIVRENYDDVELAINDLENLKWIVKLKPLTFIELDEVMVSSTRETVSSILNKIKESRFKQNAKPYNYYQSKTNFKFGATNIFSFNNIIYPSEGLKANDNNPVIYKGFHQSKNNFYSEYFKVENKVLQIPVVSTVYSSLGNHEISPIFDDKLYKYDLVTSDDFYILKFSPKKKNSNLLYDGYFILDKYDFGIIELSMVLSESNKNIWWASSFDMNDKYEYKIEKDNFKFKFSKVGDKYFLESSSRILLGVQTKGNHVGTTLECQLYNEETINQEGLIFKEYDFINQKFK
jgi:hypothetical protein